MRSFFGTVLIMFYLGFTQNWMASADEKQGNIGKYGLRYDLMKYAETEKTVTGARIRKFILKKPLVGDDAILADKIKEILAKQNPDGSFTRKPDEETGSTLLELVNLGATADNPEVKKAVEWLLKNKKAQIDSYGLLALYLLGERDHPRVREAAVKQIDGVKKNTGYPGCPWSPIVQMRTMWAVKDLLNESDRKKAENAVLNGFRWILREMNTAGCAGHKDPWGFIDVAGAIQHPLAREVVIREIPLILRGQKKNGGFGHYTYNTFRALHLHGLIDRLKSLPALPPDWEIVYSIPAPDAGLSSMTYDGEDLWVLKPATNEAIELIPNDGQVLTLINFQEKGVKFIGWKGGSLIASQPKSRKIFYIDPDNGKIRKSVTLKKTHWLGAVTEINTKMWIADLWMPCIWIMDPGKPDKLQYFQTGGPLPVHFCAKGKSIWQVDGWAPLMIQTGFNRKLINWAEIPFDGKCEGIAWDGEHLWALDSVNRRICIIQTRNYQGIQLPKSVTPEQASEALPKLLPSLDFPKSLTAAPDNTVTLANNVHNPFRIPLKVEYTWLTTGTKWNVTPPSGQTTIPPGETKTIQFKAKFDIDHLLPTPARKTVVKLAESELANVTTPFNPPATPRYTMAGRLDKPPKTDGKLGLNEYGRKPHIVKGFYKYKKPGKAEMDTGFILAYDDQNLYVTVIADEPYPEKLKGALRPRDGEIWQDDSVEIFVDANFDRKTYHQFLTGLKFNSRLDCLGGPGKGEFGTTAWNGKWTSATGKGQLPIQKEPNPVVVKPKTPPTPGKPIAGTPEPSPIGPKPVPEKIQYKKVCIAEFAIPFKTLGVTPPKKGDKWGLNITRTRFPKKDGENQELSSWTRTYTSFHVPSYFGVITFE